jgi:pimeloyl-ACP methyl ester carboxylesterase
MTRTKKMWIYIALAFLGIVSVIFLSLGLHRRPHYIQNFEEEEYGAGHPFVEPISVDDGLAVYSTGHGEPLLLLPYPHGHTMEPMAQGRLAKLLAGLDRTVVTFDVPGAYRSTREPIGDMDEMIRSADEALGRLGIQSPLDIVGHSMGGFAALAYAIERPERTRRLVLVTSAHTSLISCKLAQNVISYGHETNLCERTNGSRTARFGKRSAVLICFHRATLPDAVEQRSW